MKIQTSIQAFDDMLAHLQSEYDVFAPVLLPFKGTFSDTDSICYQKIDSILEAEFEKKSHFSAKEVVSPITQRLFYFMNGQYTVPEITEKKALVFLRACDLHAFTRTDLIYLKNGYEDPYYKALRDKVKFVLFGCKQSFESCYCVSMGTNQNDQYDMGFDLKENQVFLDVKDDALAAYFSGEKTAFEIPYVTENETKVGLPDVHALNLEKVINHPLWEEYNTRCIACGKCNFVCPTCTCTTTQDVAYVEQPQNGERRRVWASCMVAGFSTMAGGHDFRVENGQKMRFKTMHKVFDFKKRFDMTMCVGCGRCDDACPEYISFSTIINKVTDAQVRGEL